MDRQILTNELKVIIGDYLKDRGLDLIDLISRYEGRDLVLRILTDRPEGGITLGDCAYINREISAILDEKEIVQQRCVLEVASPGLDRPLEARNDFSRCLNKKVRVFLKEAVKGKMEFEGVINKVEANSAYFKTENEIIEVPWLKISRAKQVI